MPAADHVAELIAALRKGGPESIARLVRRVPAFADAIDGRGRYALVVHWGVAHPGPQRISDLSGLADYLARPTPTGLRIMHATRNEHQLLVLAALDGGRLDRAKTRAALGLRGDRAGQQRLERAATGLSELLLSDPGASWVALLPRVAEQIHLPGVTVRVGTDQVTRDSIAAILRTIGVTAAGTRKFELVDAWEAALRHPDTLQRIAAALDPRSRSLLTSLAERGVVSVAAAGIDYYHRKVGRTPLHDLVDHGLVGVNEHDQRCWVWLDAVIGLHGGSLFQDWSEPAPRPQPLAAPAVASLPPATGALDAVVDTFASTPVNALKTGGLGVQTVRTIAKAQRRTTVEVGLLSALAIELGLLGMVVLSSRGRGRNTVVERGWQPDAAQIAAWRGLPAPVRAARVVQQWLDSDRLPLTGGPIERYESTSQNAAFSVARHALIRVLLEQRQGAGLDLPELVALAAFRHHFWFDADIVSQIVGEARVLGLVPADGPIGLTTTARLLLTDQVALADSLLAGATIFTVQADHTVIAPPGLSPDVEATLARFAALESDAGARIYRITDASVAAALDTGLDAGAILAFLAAHSAVGVTPNVERTVHDAADRHGQLRIGSATTWIACDDPVQLAHAVAVKAAKLTTLTPTAAVSPLPEAKVLAALRSKGVMPARTETATAEPPVRVRQRHDGHVLEPRAQLVHDLADIDEVAKRLFDAPPPPLELVGDRRRPDDIHRLRAQLDAQRRARRRELYGDSFSIYDISDDFDEDDFEEDELE